MTPFRTERLDNDVELDFFDLSNRYFGDYHRVCVKIHVRVPRPDREEPLVKVQTLERMGVAGAAVEATRDGLVDAYLQNAGRYLAHVDYPARLLAAQASSRHRLPPIGFRNDVP